MLKKFNCLVPAQNPCNPSGKDDPQTKSECSQCFGSWRPKRIDKIRIKAEKKELFGKLMSFIHFFLNIVGAWETSNKPQTPT